MQLFCLGKYKFIFRKGINKTIILKLIGKKINIKKN